MHALPAVAEAVSYTHLDVYKRQVFDGSSAVGYDFTADDYAAIAQAETIEVLFQFTANPTSGYFDLFSSAQGAGQDLSYYAPQLQHYVNTGSGYRCTEATVPLNAWTHV